MAKAERLTSYCNVSIHLNLEIHFQSPNVLISKDCKSFLGYIFAWHWEVAQGVICLNEDKETDFQTHSSEEMDERTSWS